MKISKLASTVFLTTTICTIYLFALIYYTLLNEDQKTINILKESLTLTSSFFGGISTLVAAYIATQLFNDWRDAHNANIKKALIEKLLDSCDLHEGSILKVQKHLHLLRQSLSLMLNLTVNYFIGLKIKRIMRIYFLLYTIATLHFYGVKILSGNICYVYRMKATLII